MASSSVRPLRDPNTLSNYNHFVTKHTIADLVIDFEKKSLSGVITLDLESVTNAEADFVILDTSHLQIHDIQLGGKSTANWKLSTRSEPYGSALRIGLSSGIEKGEVVKLAIRVNTTEQCTALQWLTPAQTANKKHPYMFSQCQAIHARSLFPCQDTPDVKSTYEFLLRSHLPVLASGLPTGSRDFKPGQNKAPGTMLYSFSQKVPMPSYLFAVASGDIASASIGPRSTIWTGPEELTGAKWELENDMEHFMQTAESLVYPYAWTSYNVLVLPPSFPYGGMENPIFTFATPTIISGDRENIDVIAHELSHSWSGNLVSCASWQHFWLNEGWTTYLERRIQAALHGESSRDFSAIIGWKALSDSIAQFGEDHNFTKMIPDLKGEDPDDAFSSVPYEKGFIFLLHLEELVGKTKWDKFIPHYFTKYKEKSLDSFEFKATLLGFFEDDPDASSSLKKLDWDSWFYKPGFPPKPNFDTSLVDTCYKLAEKWEQLTGERAGSNFRPKKDDIKGWSANQVVVFLEKVQEFKSPLSKKDAQLMGDTYGFAQSMNVEVVSRYYGVGLQSKYEGAYQPAADLLGRVGRMKFVRPLYRQLNEVHHKLALATFEKNKYFYHPICRSMVEKILAIDSKI